MCACSLIPCGSSQRTALAAPQRRLLALFGCALALARARERAAAAGRGALRAAAPRIVSAAPSGPTVLTSAWAGGAVWRGAWGGRGRKQTASSKPCEAVLRRARAAANVNVTLNVPPVSHQPASPGARRAPGQPSASAAAGGLPAGCATQRCARSAATLHSSSPPPPEVPQRAARGTGATHKAHRCSCI
jgi:hypothetical protein